MTKPSVSARSSSRHPVLNAARLFALLLVSFIVDSVVAVFHRAAAILSTNKEPDAGGRNAKHPLSNTHSAAVKKS